MTLWWLTLQSVLARPRSWVVGLLAAGAAALLTPGVSLMNSIHEGTRRSLIESGAGDLQVYAAASAGTPQVVVGPGGVPDLLPIPDYAALEPRLSAMPGVRAVVPLELGMGATFRGNALDEKLAVLRAVAREPATEARDARLRRLGEDLRQTLERVARNADRRGEAFAEDPVFTEDLRVLREAAQPAFWAGFTEDPQGLLELLENRVARQAGEGEELPVDYLGTDVTRFAQAFPRFELVSGQLPPPGTRGLVMGHATYEQHFKHPIAVRLDTLRRDRGQGYTLAEDEQLRTLVARNLAEVPDLVARLDVERATALQAELARVLGETGELETLLTRFLSVDDANFDTRYGQFYGELAPHLPLYRLKPGDTLTLRSPLENVISAPVRVYGTFRFRGLGGDDSRVNTLSLVDLVTARRLSGRPTEAQQAEARELFESFGMEGDATAPPESLEAFHPPAIVEGEAQTEHREMSPVFERARALPETYSEEDLTGGAVMQAAVVLEPGVAAEDVAARIGALPGGDALATVGWQEAGGLLGGLVVMLQAVLLLFALLLSSFVALVAAGTLLLLARERVAEVGTLRAVGMQRREVFTSLLLEGALLGGAGSLLGAALGALLLRLATGGGVAVEDGSLQFFLGGPVLHPELSLGGTLGVVVAVTGVVVLASLVPAWRGSAVAPIEAMRKGEG
ncbi:FtsX-like permease family protein [Myxococcus sp. Y35]|uniref:FtsX-like permease family protein n=1 Tax=Pseudomyxococcus flavus TaxID=3115648 RepID=UPI003CF6C5A7